MGARVSEPPKEENFKEIYRNCSWKIAKISRNLLPGFGQKNNNNWKFSPTRLGERSLRRSILIIQNLVCLFCEGGGELHPAIKRADILGFEWKCQR